MVHLRTRKKSLIDKAKVDWDCEGTPGMISKFNKSSSDMFGEVNACHNRVMSQLKLDVEVGQNNHSFMPEIFEDFYFESRKLRHILPLHQALYF